MSRGVLALSLLLGAFAGACLGAAPEPQDPLNRDSPQSSVVAFLEACHSRNYQRSWRYLDLRKLPADQRLQRGTQLSQQLEQILDRDVQFDVGSLSRNPEGDHANSANRAHVDSFVVDGKTLDLELEHVTFRSGLQVWLFSSDSVERIPQIARLLSDSPIEKHLPEPLVAWRFMDTAMWRWIALVVLAAALTALSGVLSRLALSLIRLPAKRFAPRMNSGLLDEFTGPLRLLLIVAGVRMGVEWINPSALLRLYLDRAATLLFFWALAWLGMSFVDLAILHVRKALEAKHQTFAYSVLPLTTRVLKILILLIAIAAILGSWGYNTTTILAGLGVGGLAIALAAQKTIENLFGGVAVITDRPVTVGDFCRFGDRMGTVEDIGLRSTRIRTPERTLVTVPNGQFSSMTLENFSKRDKMWFHFILNLRRDTTADQVRELLRSISKTLAEHPKVEPGTLPVRFVGVGTYSLDLEVVAYITTRNGDEFLSIQQDLFLSILDEVEGAGTALALPTQAYYAMERSPAWNGASKPSPETAPVRQ
jgi:MscS family membrane protein